MTFLAIWTATAIVIVAPFAWANWRNSGRA